jgi:hypothetical protein
MLKSLILACAMSMVAVADASMPCDASRTDRRGCCSHHQGVCGCDQRADRLRCCDGTNSPSCRCGD